MMLATKMIGGFVIVAVQEEFVGRIKSLRHSVFQAFAGEEIPDIAAAVQIGLYMARSPASTPAFRPTRAMDRSSVTSPMGTPKRQAVKEIRLNVR
jgi:hypothetical protein